MPFVKFNGKSRGSKQKLLKKIITESIDFKIGDEP